MKRSLGIVGVVAALSALVVGPIPAQAGVPGSPQPVLTSSAFEFNPAIGAGYFAWSQNSDARPNRYNTYVATDPTDPLTWMRTNARGTNGYGGGFDDTTSTLIFQQQDGSASDLKLYDVATGTVTDPPGVNTRRWEWSPTMSGDWILFGRNQFRRATSPWRVVLQNTATGENRVLGEVTNRCGCIFPGQVKGNYATWYNFKQNAQVFLHDITAGTTMRIPNPGPKDQYSSGVTADGTVYFARAGNACGENVRFMRATLGDATPDRFEELPDGKDVTDRPYAFDDGVSGTTLIFGRFGCRRGTSDIYRLDNAQLGGGLTASPAGGRDYGPRAEPLGARP